MLKDICFNKCSHKYSLCICRCVWVYYNHPYFYSLPLPLPLPAPLLSPLLPLSLILLLVGSNTDIALAWLRQSSGANCSSYHNLPARVPLPDTPCNNHVISSVAATLTRLHRCLGSIPGAGHLFRYVTNQPPKANSAVYPSGVGKWVPASAGKAKAAMVHSVSGWTRGVQVKLWDPLRMRAIPEHLRGVFTTRCYTNSRLPYLYLTQDTEQTLVPFREINLKACTLDISTQNIWLDQDLKAGSMLLTCSSAKHTMLNAFAHSILVHSVR